MRHTPCRYCPPALAAAKAPLFVEGGRSPTAIRGEKKTPPVTFGDSPLFIEGATVVFSPTHWRQNAADVHNGVARTLDRALPAAQADALVDS